MAASPCRNTSAAWAERYGGGLKRVESLFKNSLAALEAHRLREAETERREREAERRKIEAEEAAKRERLEHQAEVTSAPGDGLVRSDDATRHAGDGADACRRSHGHFEIDAERQKKAALGRRCDLCF